MIFLYKKRAAFSMITAIFVILLIATMGAFIMNLSGKMIQGTTSQYRKEQAILYAKSYTEFAVMAATSQPCVKKITARLDGSQTEVKKGQGYFVDVRIKYIGTNSTCPNPNKIRRGTITDTRAIDNVILIDTYVRYRNPESIGAKNALPWSVDPGITYHRRTLQRL
ncbi:MAG: type II secretion system protein [Sulfurovum sp.]|nr:type II secretion system protein [Sulfurovum sp.]